MRTLIVVMVAFVLGAPQRSGDPTGALAQGGKGLIAGQVVDPGTGKPVPEALVTLRVGQVTGAESPRVLTDAQGRFVFVNVPAGAYGLQSQKLGYLPSAYGQRIPNAPSGLIDFADAQVLTDVIVPLWKYAAIGGTVTDEAGQPIVGVRVQAFKRVVEVGEVRLVPPDPYSSLTTDDRGVYRLSTLAPGEYAVAVPSTLATFPVDVMPQLMNGGPAQMQYAAAMNELSVLGSARNQQVGDSVLFINNRAVIPPPPSANNVTSVYRTTFAPDTALPAQATVVSLGSGEERSGVNISLRPSRAVRVSGRLVGPDGPMGNTALRLFATGRWRAGFSSIDPTATAVTDAAGRFTMLGIPEGEYIASASIGEPGRNLVSANQPVVVADVDVTDLVVNLRRPAQVTGHFEIRSGQPPPRAGFLWVTGAPIGSGLVDFVLGNIGTDIRPTPVQPGTYALTFRSPPNLTCSSVMLQGRDVSDEPFVVGNDDIDVTVICGEVVTRLSGTVRNQSGAAESDAAIVVFPSERRFWSGQEIRLRRFQQAYTDKAGSFTIANLPAGDYFVAAIPIAQSDLWQDPKTLDVLARSATRTTVASGGSPSLDLKTVRIR